MHVWDRTAGCQLHSTCEDVQGLLPVLAWQPNGRHLYTIQQPHAAQQQRGVTAAARGVVKGCVDHDFFKFRQRAG
jgi:hypothetical protein